MVVRVSPTVHSMDFVMVICHETIVTMVECQCETLLAMVCIWY